MELCDKVKLVYCTLLLKSLGQKVEQHTLWFGLELCGIKFIIHTTKVLQ